MTGTDFLSKKTTGSESSLEGFVKHLFKPLRQDLPPGNSAAGHHGMRIGRVSAKALGKY